MASPTITLANGPSSATSVLFNLCTPVLTPQAAIYPYSSGCLWLPRRGCEYQCASQIHPSTALRDRQNPSQKGHTGLLIARRHIYTTLKSKTALFNYSDNIFTLTSYVKWYSLVICTARRTICIVTLFCRNAPWCIQDLAGITSSLRPAAEFLGMPALTVMMENTYGRELLGQSRAPGVRVTLSHLCPTRRARLIPPTYMEFLVHWFLPPLVRLLMNPVGWKQL